MKKAITVARVVESLYTWRVRSAAAKGTHGRKEVPKLPLRQPADEWTKLVVPVAGKRGWCIAFTTFQLVRHQVILKGRVELWLQEGKKQVEKIDGMRIYGHGYKRESFTPNF